MAYITKKDYGPEELESEIYRQKILFAKNENKNFIKGKTFFGHFDCFNFFGTGFHFSKFQGCHFVNCTFSNNFFISCDFEYCSFKNCWGRDLSLKNCFFEHTKFQDCSFVKSSIQSSFFEQCFFEDLECYRCFLRKVEHNPQEKSPLKSDVTECGSIFFNTVSK